MVSHIRNSRQSKSRAKCFRPGPVGRNPYLNFLREFRKKCCGLTPIKTIQQGAKAWNNLKPDERLRYIEEAFYAPKRRRTSMRAGVSKRKSRPMSKRRSVRRDSTRSRRKSRSRSRSKRSKRPRSSHKIARSRSKNASQPKIMCNL